LAQQGLPLFFVDGLPTRASDGTAVDETLRQLAGLPNVRVAPLAELADTITGLGFHDVACTPAQPYLRCYHYRIRGWRSTCSSTSIPPSRSTPASILRPAPGRAL